MSKGNDVPPSETEDREPFGSFLRERREARGLSLEEAVTRTRIRKSFLEALEEDRFDKIPGETYVCGFLRTYAAFLGFDPDEAVDFYNQRFHGASASPSPKRAEKEKTKMAALQRWWIWGIGLVVLALVIVGVLMMCSRNDTSASSDSARMSSGVSAEGPSDEAVSSLQVGPRPDSDQP